MTIGRLSSVSGTIRVEVPPASKFDLYATTNSGDIVIVREDLQNLMLEPSGSLKK